VPVTRSPGRPRYHRPLGWPVIALLALAVGLLAPLVFAGAISFAYRRVGIGPQAALVVLALTLLGSFVNVPIARFPSEQILTAREVRAFGVRWLVPLVEEQRGPVLAVNVGGAIVPVCVSLWILAHDPRLWRTLAATAIVALAVHAIARPVPGLGIAVPPLTPPVIAVAATVLLLGRSAPPAAYVAGTLGTLIGADLLNLRLIRSLGAPVASIGGAGTFDGIFLTGILAVLLAAVI
jgi:uncharacterized membrane protein